MNNKFIAVLQVVGAFFLWSTLGIFFNRVQLPTSIYVVFGSAVGLSCLFGYFHLTQRRLPRFQLSFPLVLLFLVAAVKGVIWFKALSLYPIARAMLIHNLAPAIVLILSPLFLREKPRLNHLIAVMTGFIGLLILLQVDGTLDLINLGAMFSIIVAFCSAIQDIVQRRLSKSLPGINQAFVFVLGQALGSVIFLLKPTAAVSWLEVGNIFYFGLIGTALPIILLSNAYSKLKAYEVATLGYTEPMLGAIWGSLFLNQAVSPSMAVAGLLIFLSGVTAVKETG